MKRVHPMLRDKQLAEFCGAGKIIGLAMTALAAFCLATTPWLGGQNQIGTLFLLAMTATAVLHGLSQNAVLRLQLCGIRI